MHWDTKLDAEEAAALRADEQAAAEQELFERDVESGFKGSREEWEQTIAEGRARLKRILTTRPPEPITGPPVGDDEIPF